MMEGAATCRLRLQRGLKGGDNGLHLVRGHIGDLQERERDCRPVHCPPAIAGAPCLGGIVDINRNKLKSFDPEEVSAWQL